MSSSRKKTASQQQLQIYAPTPEIIQQAPRQPRQQKINYPGYDNYNENYDEIIKRTLDGEIEIDDNGKKFIKSGIKTVERLYHMCLFKIENKTQKRKFKIAMYKYILDNNVKIIGGKFDKSRTSIYILYYTT